ncbi:hypothetical protein J7643_09120 [bacterium]|nr:hypothetical protein [bacterium]
MDIGGFLKSAARFDPMAMGGHMAMDLLQGKNPVKAQIDAAGEVIEGLGEMAQGLMQLGQDLVTKENLADFGKPEMAQDQSQVTGGLAVLDNAKPQAAAPGSDFGAVSATPQAATSIDPERAKKFAALFDEADMNHDGKLSGDELNTRHRFYDPAMYGEVSKSQFIGDVAALHASAEQSVLAIAKEAMGRDFTGDGAFLESMVNEYMRPGSSQESIKQRFREFEVERLSQSAEPVSAGMSRQLINDTIAKIYQDLTGKDINTAGNGPDYWANRVVNEKLSFADVRKQMGEYQQSVAR